MSRKDIRFQLLRVDPSGARRGRFQTQRGTVETPTFMPVGTAGFVRSTPMRDVTETGAQVVLANTYHLSLGDRLQTVKRAGGLHAFMGWDGTILTDSGGFQVFSLEGREVTEEASASVSNPRGKPISWDPNAAWKSSAAWGPILSWPSMNAWNTPPATNTSSSP